MTATVPRVWLLVFTAAAAAVGLGCGGTSVGSSCKEAGPIECDESGRAAYWCDGGRVALIGCRGSGQCVAGSSVGDCLNGKPKQGDRCLKVEEGRSYCDPLFSDQKLVCTPLNGPAQFFAEPCRGCAEPTLHATSCQP